MRLISDSFGIVRCMSVSYKSLLNLAETFRIPLNVSVAFGSRLRTAELCCVTVRNLAEGF